MTSIKMAKNFVFVYCCTFFILISTMKLLCKASDDDRKVYIVYMGSLPESEVYSPLSRHHNILQGVLKDSSIENSMVRSYQRSFNGFAARLTDRERLTISNMKEVVSVFPNTIYRPQTTRSWDFMGFGDKIERNPRVESDIIIGVIDTGITPNADSFKDDGFGPPPDKWKGVCHGGKNFTCNNKLIGARHYSSYSAIDLEGHGTHTASTAAGARVKGASFLGLGEGTARGAVPSSRIAAYKVCNPGIGCTSTDILAAFDDAIADGVHIITLSLGANAPMQIEHDSIAIGAFHAMKRGVLTVNSAGNSGPDGTVSSVSPWILTVAASTTDRKFVDKVVLGDGRTLSGLSLNTFTPEATAFPLVHGKDVSNSKDCSRPDDARYCNCIDSNLVKGKIIVCDEFYGSFPGYGSGAVGSVSNYTMSIANLSEIPPFPALALSPEDYQVLLSYTNSTRNPKGNILKSETIKGPSAPIVASFSSRGPNLIVPDILKPDISAPGVDILAAYSPLISVTDQPSDNRRVKYNILSGTSMSCPHAAGVSAYVKSLHPDWSPSALKSSIMTTAWNMNHTSDDEFAYGSGHINPVNAAHPGLVYETLEKDYINMLCSLVHNESSVRLISGDKNVTCNNKTEMISARDLNYPSMAAKVRLKKPFKITFKRRVKNVGNAKSVYKANIFQSSNEVAVKVTPSVLSFKHLHEEKGFEVSVVGRGLAGPSVVSASLIWSDGNHTVRSPIVVYTYIF